MSTCNAVVQKGGELNSKDESAMSTKVAEMEGAEPPHENKHVYAWPYILYQTIVNWTTDVAFAIPFEIFYYANPDLKRNGNKHCFAVAGSNVPVAEGTADAVDVTQRLLVFF